MTSEVGFQFGQECSICLEDFDKSNFVSASCGHSFHPICIKGWIDEKGSGLKDVKCPNCMETTLRVQELTLQNPEIFPPRIRIQKIATWGGRANFNRKRFYALSSHELASLEKMLPEPLTAVLGKSVYVSRGALSSLSSKYKDLEGVKDIKHAFKSVTENGGTAFKDLPSLMSPVRGSFIKLGVVPLALAGGLVGGVLGLGIGGIKGAIKKEQSVGDGALRAGIIGAAFGGGALGLVGYFSTSATVKIVEMTTGGTLYKRMDFKRNIVQQVEMISMVLKVKNTCHSLDIPDFQERLGKIDSLDRALWGTFTEDQKKSIYAHFTVYQDTYKERSSETGGKIDRMLLSSLIQFESGPGSYKKVRFS